MSGPKFIILLFFLFTTAGTQGASLPVSSDTEVSDTAAAAAGDTVASLPLCHYKSTSDARVHDEATDQLLPDDMVLCASEQDYCFSYWTYESPNGTATTEGGRDNLKWLAQGCFSSQDSCRQSDCVASRESPANTFFCCCQGSRCNEMVKVPPQLRESPGGVVSPLKGSTASGSMDGSKGRQSYSEDSDAWFIKLYYILAASVTVVILVTATICLSYFSKRMKRKGLLMEQDAGLLHQQQPNTNYHKRRTSTTTTTTTKLPYDAPPQYCDVGGVHQPHEPAPPPVDISTIVLTEIIGRGRFGCVYKGTSGGRLMVVKVFPATEKESYNNELYAYSQPFMRHPNLLTLLGSGSMPPNQWGLVLPYCSGGRLTAHLTEETLSWSDICRVAVGATRGLAHLHAPITAAGLEKPSMSHRDFNSRNIVLRSDLTAVVIDLGLSVCVKGGTPCGQKKGDTPTLNEAGSLRYMAPELLERAVNLSECESALRQIDVYALGLVLWECLTRCHDAVQRVMPYTLPYQTDLGNDPRADAMLNFVVREKRRPPLPPIKEGLSPSEAAAVRLLQDTIEECWDHDAEARLSAQTVVQRLEQLPHMWRNSQDSGIDKANTSLGDDDCSDKSSLPNYQDSLINSVKYYSDSLIQNNSSDATELPAYYEGDTHTSIVRDYSRYTDVSTNRRSSQSKEDEQLLPRHGDECSSRTLQTLLSPSVSGQPDLMLQTGSMYDYGNNPRLIVRRAEDTQQSCSSSVVQKKGSAAPVSVLHPHSSSISSSLSSSASSLAIPSVHYSTSNITNSSVKRHQQNNSSAFSRLWSKMKKRLKSNDSGICDSDTSSDLQPKQLLLPQSECTVRGASIVQLTSNQRLVSSPSTVGTIKSPVQDSSFHHLRSQRDPCGARGTRSFSDVKTVLETDLENDVSLKTKSCSDSLKPLDTSDWCNTIPARRKRAERFANRDRPVSLEIRCESLEHNSSPLGNYLSTSCNFKTPDEVVLRKAKTRVKTPRHPPLPRLSLNGSVTH